MYGAVGGSEPDGQACFPYKGEDGTGSVGLQHLSQPLPVPVTVPKQPWTL